MPNGIGEITETGFVAELRRGQRQHGRTLAQVQVPQPAKDAFTVAATPATTYTLTAIPYQGTGGSSLNLSLNGLELVEGVDYTVDYTTAIVTVSATLKGTPTPADVLTADYWTTGDLIAATAVAESGLITDNFNRANSTTSLGTTSDGRATWTAVLGTWGISSNAAYCPVVNTSGSVMSFAYVESGQPDGTVQGTIAGPGGWEFGITWRYADPNNCWYVACLGGINLSYVAKMVAGVRTRPKFFTWTTGDVLAVTFSGNNITLNQNGSTIWSTTDSDNAANTKHGMNALASNVGQCDDWSFAQ